MLYLSQILGRPIRDLERERVATVKDVIVRLGEEDHPKVTGVVARYRRRDFFVSRWRITEFDEQGVNWLSPNDYGEFFGDPHFRFIRTLQQPRTISLSFTMNW